MKKNFFLLAFTFIAFGIFAQKNLTVSVYFETGKFDLEKSSVSSLENFAKEIAAFGDYDLQIEAYTDDKGSSDFNKMLAENRANAVQSFFIQKNIKPKSLNINALGEINNGKYDDETRKQNRRVDIKAVVFEIENIDALFSRLIEKSNTVQSFSFDAKENFSVKGEKGTILDIESNSFEFEDGTQPKGLVDVKLTEALDPSDWILNSLTTLSENKMLETGGMLNLEASSEGRKLILIKGKAIRVNMPTKQYAEGMELFYGNHDAKTKNVTWLQAKDNRGTKIKIEKSAKLYYLDKQLIAKIIADVKIPTLEPNPRPEFTLLPTPIRPITPTVSKLSKRPIFIYQTPVQKRWKKLSKETLDAHYNEAADAFIKRVERYQKDSILFEKRWNDYNTLNNKYQIENAERTKILLANKEKLAQFLILEYKKSTLEATKVLLQRPVKNWRFREDDHLYSVLLEHINMILHDKFFRYKKYEDVIEQKYFDLSATQFDFQGYDTGKKIADSVLIECNFQKAIREVQSEFAISKLSQGSTAALSSYMFNITQLGWANCDKFTQNTAEKMFVNVKENEKAKAYILCNEIKSFIPFETISGVSYKSPLLPKNLNVKIIMIKLKDGKALYSRQDVALANVKEALSPNYKTLTISELGEEMKKLNN